MVLIKNLCLLLISSIRFLFFLPIPTLVTLIHDDYLQLYKFGWGFVYYVTVIFLLSSWFLANLFDQGIFRFLNFHPRENRFWLLFGFKIFVKAIIASGLSIWGAYLGESDFTPERGNRVVCGTLLIICLSVGTLIDDYGLCDFMVSWLLSKCYSTKDATTLVASRMIGITFTNFIKQCCSEGTFKWFIIILVSALLFWVRFLLPIARLLNEWTWSPTPSLADFMCDKLGIPRNRPDDQNNNGVIVNNNDVQGRGGLGGNGIGLSVVIENYQYVLFV